MKDICESTTRPINLIKDIYLPRNEVTDLNEPSLIMKLQIKKRVNINSVDSTHMPGQLHIGDITSDGFPDLILTLKNDDSQNGETEVHILQNIECNAALCSKKTHANKRRTFVLKDYSEKVD